MSRTRDIIEEIAQVRQRRRFGRAIAELPLRLFALERAFKEHDQKNEELTRYFPVALIACIEGYFRLAIKELVDAGEPYITNAERPASSIKLDFAVVRAIHGKAITVGELVGHSVPLSRLDHIESSMSSLLGASFLDRMRMISDRWDHEVRGEPERPILSNPDEVFAGVAKAFELRHIICHEIASAHEILYQDVARCFECCVAFLRAADELVSETLHPGAPLTQSDMNVAAGELLAEARQSMAQAVSDLRARLSGDELAAFNDAQAAWEEACTAWAEFDAMEVKGGTMWPTVRAGSEAELVKGRTDELRSYRRMSD
ncbi:DUF1311 domain-containing protein [Comamonas sp. CMM03]|uniref:lysozyme inhibitor LprI family protein n=1 Tax=Comamonas TaxID=283 RepID=UPI001C461EA3|nr:MULTISPECIES: lysozyme inhibitor LprI family protein [Comamonas]MBV7417147.1 DUF1311 domain-containing protein [Comamonas sp. CMM03]